MHQLIADLEAATVGSEVLDVAICKAICNYGPDDPLWHCLPYSTCLTAAVTWVPEGWQWLVRNDENGGFANLTRGGPPVQIEEMQVNPCWQDSPTYAPTPALALCIAIAKAHQAMAEAAYA